MIWCLVLPGNQQLQHCLQYKSFSVISRNVLIICVILFLKMLKYKSLFHISRERVHHTIVLISPAAHGGWTWFLHKTRASLSSGSKLAGMAFKKWNLKHILQWKDWTFIWWYFTGVCSCLSDRLPSHHWFKWWTTICGLKIQIFQSLRSSDHLDLPSICFSL